MKKNFEKGEYVLSMAGHDKKHYYIIVDDDESYVYIVDGVRRLMDSPKKKSKKHVQIIHSCDPLIMEKIQKQEQLLNEDIAAAIARYETRLCETEEGI